jgi:hypothetical protein
MQLLLTLTAWLVSKLLLALTSKTILGSRSHRTHDHIFLPHDSRVVQMINFWVLSISVNCCKPLAAQLLLLSGPVGIHGQFFVHSKTMEYPLWWEEVSIFPNWQHICYAIIQHGCICTQCWGKGICTVYTPYTLHHITIINNIYTRPLSVQACVAGYDLINHSEMAVPWMVESLAATKFKPLLLSVHGFSLFNCT